MLPLRRLMRLISQEFDESNGSPYIGRAGSIGKRLAAGGDRLGVGFWGGGPAPLAGRPKVARAGG
jgi:hypothetical protein